MYDKTKVDTVASRYGKLTYYNYEALNTDILAVGKFSSVRFSDVNMLFELKITLYK